MFTLDIHAQIYGFPTAIYLGQSYLFTRMLHWSHETGLSYVA